MPFVLDASVALAWVFADEDHPAAVAALERLRTDDARVPGLWWFEVRKALLVNERRRRLTEADTAIFLKALSRMAITIDQLTGGAELLVLARRHHLTAYDAAYLELALRDGVPLATSNAELAGAARAEQVPLLGDKSA